jgi:hypothetical protein
MTLTSPENVIEVRVDQIAQLFHTLDPFPFRDKDLDREAEEYIVGWARELPTKVPFKIIVHFPDDESQTKAAGELSGAFGRYFAGRAAVIHGDLNELFRIGRRSLAIGVPRQLRMSFTLILMFRALDFLQSSEFELRIGYVSQTGSRSIQ